MTRRGILNVIGTLAPPSALPHISFAKHPRPVAGWNPRNRKVYTGGNVPGSLRRHREAFKYVSEIANLIRSTVAD